VPLVVEEPMTDQVREWLHDDLEMVTWGWTSVELASAVERRAREGLLTRPQRRQVLDSFRRLADGWDEVIDLVAVRSRAIPILARHPLRAADAAQLAAALVVADGRRGLPFVCLDERLALAAEREGLSVLSG
jgi:uncharacterized protein